MKVLFILKIGHDTQFESTTLVVDVISPTICTRHHVHNYLDFIFIFNLDIRFKNALSVFQNDFRC
jgi:hypothetical protein